VNLRNALGATNRDRCICERPVQSTVLAGRVPEDEQFGDAAHCMGLAVFETDAERVRSGFGQAADRRCPGHERFLSEIRSR
jgi:hypothetical protein